MENKKKTFLIKLKKKAKIIIKITEKYKIAQSMIYIIHRQEQMTSGGNRCPNSMTPAPKYSVSWHLFHAGDLKDNDAI